MKRIILFANLLLQAIGIYAQERIYIQTDKAYYAPADTVWFRAHLMDAVTNSLVSRSRFVYIKLHDKKSRYKLAQSHKKSEIVPIYRVIIWRNLDFFVTLRQKISNCRYGKSNYRT